MNWVCLRTKFLTSLTHWRKLKQCERECRGRVKQEHGVQCEIDNFTQQIIQIILSWFNAQNVPKGKENRQISVFTSDIFSVFDSSTKSSASRKIHRGHAWRSVKCFISHWTQCFCLFKHGHETFSRSLGQAHEVGVTPCVTVIHPNMMMVLRQTPHWLIHFSLDLSTSLLCFLRFGEQNRLFRFEPR